MAMHVSGWLPVWYTPLHILNCTDLTRVLEMTGIAVDHKALRAQWSSVPVITSKT